jgi:hypothetical protein
MASMAAPNLTSVINHRANRDRTEKEILGIGHATSCTMQCSACYVTLSIDTLIRDFGKTFMTARTFASQPAVTVKYQTILPQLTMPFPFISDTTVNSE